MVYVLGTKARIYSVRCLSDRFRTLYLVDDLGMMGN